MSQYDEAIELSQRHLLELNPHSLRSVVDQQLSTANYRLSPKGRDAPGKRDRTIISNNQFWEMILREKLRYGMTLKFESFFLFEWFPRSPGLFYTGSARYAREEARQRVTVADGVVAYDPYGKASMLDGGIGAIRLRPIEIAGGEFHLMTASSSGVCHEGCPVAIPTAMYNECIDEITTRGVALRSLIGKLKFIPERLVSVFDGYTEVPQMYLQVEEMRRAEYPKSRSIEELRVSVAVSFLSTYEGPERIYASYVTFNPRDPNSFAESVKWLEEDYVGRAYRGRVLTDFDEHRSHFKNAPFSLKKVMTLTLDKSEVTHVFNHFNIGRVEHLFSGISKLQARINVEEIVEQKNEVNVINSQGVNINIAEYMRGVSNHVTQALSNSLADDQTKNLLTRLAQQINDVAPQIDSVTAEQLGADVKAVADEIALSHPRKSRLQSFLTGIKEAAISLRDIGAPIVETVKLLLPLVTG